MSVRTQSPVREEQRKFSVNDIVRGFESGVSKTENRKTPLPLPKSPREVNKEGLAKEQVIKQEHKTNRPPPVVAPRNPKQKDLNTVEEKKERGSNSKEVLPEKDTTEYSAQGASIENAESPILKEEGSIPQPATKKITIHSRTTLEYNLIRNKETKITDKTADISGASIENSCEKAKELLPKNAQNCETFYQKKAEHDLITHRFITEDKHEGKIYKGAFGVHFKIDKKNEEIRYMASTFENYKSKNESIETSNLEGHISELSKQIEDKRENLIGYVNRMKTANKGTKEFSSFIQREQYDSLREVLKSCLSAFENNVGGALENTSYKNLGDSAVAECTINTIDKDGKTCPQLLSIKVSHEGISSKLENIEIIKNEVKVAPLPPPKPHPMRTNNTAQPLNKCDDNSLTVNGIKASEIVNMIDEELKEIKPKLQQLHSQKLASKDKEKSEIVLKMANEIGPLVKQVCNEQVTSAEKPKLVSLDYPYESEQKGVNFKYALKGERTLDDGTLQPCNVNFNVRVSNDNVTVDSTYNDIEQKAEEQLPPPPPLPPKMGAEQPSTSQEAKLTTPKDNSIRTHISEDTFDELTDHLNQFITDEKNISDFSRSAKFIMQTNNVIRIAKNTLEELSEPSKKINKIRKKFQSRTKEINNLTDTIKTNQKTKETLTKNIRDKIINIFLKHPKLYCLADHKKLNKIRSSEIFPQAGATNQESTGIKFSFELPVELREKGTNGSTYSRGCVDIIFNNGKPELVVRKLPQETVSNPAY